MSGHSIAWEYDRDHVTARMVCTEPEDANCRLSSDCDCEAWSILRDPDGTPFHLYGGFVGGTFNEVEVRHDMKPMGECNICLYLEDDVQEMNNGHETRMLAITPVTTQWEGDCYTWSFA